MLQTDSELHLDARPEPSMLRTWLGQIAQQRWLDAMDNVNGYRSGIPGFWHFSSGLIEFEKLTHTPELKGFVIREGQLVANQPTWFSVGPFSYKNPQNMNLSPDGLRFDSPVIQPISFGLQHPHVGEILTLDRGELVVQTDSRGRPDMGSPPFLHIIDTSGMSGPAHTLSPVEPETLGAWVPHAIDPSLVTDEGIVDPPSGRTMLIIHGVPLFIAVRQYTDEQAQLDAGRNDELLYVIAPHLPVF